MGNGTTHFLSFDERERDLIVSGLLMRRNYIETGNPVLCSQDLANQGRHKEVKVLSVDQMRTVIAIDDLVKRIVG